MTMGNPAEAWRALREGNARFLSGRREHPNQDADRRAQVALGQEPFAVIFGCSDSRVAAEIVFDRGLGDLFVVRTAGHVVDSGVLGSIEFGVSVLQIPLVVVLGHDGCGAVNATLQAYLDGTMPGGFVRDIVALVSPSLIAAAGELDEIGDEHIRLTGEFVVDRSRAISEQVAAGTCAVIGVSYHLEEGRARLVSVIGEIGEAAP
jgi:carbonic anhydrase